MKKPLVSIIIPVYNGSNYVCEAIESALSQTYDNLEIIVVNDGSNDEEATEKAVLSFGDAIRYFKKENGGVSSALNVGIRESKGEYISWLSHDDIYYSTKIEEQISHLLSLENKRAIAMCRTKQIDKRSKEIGSASKKTFENRIEISWEQALMYIIQHSCNGCALLIPKEAFRLCGGFCEELRYSQDYLMWVTFFSSGYSLVCQEYVGVGSRIHEQQLTQTGRVLFEHDSNMICGKILPRLIQLNSRKYRYLYEYAKSNAIHGNKSVSKRCMQQGKLSGALFVHERIFLRMWCLYGGIRPLLRKVFYRLCKRVKTN